MEHEVYNLVKKIPKGRVTTYKDIAAALGNPKLARQVGNILHKNPYQDVPCFKVIRSDSQVGGFARGTKEKIKKLRNDGIAVTNNKVNLRKYRARLSASK